MNAVVNSVMSS